MTEVSRVSALRGRHPGQGPRDPAVLVSEIWDRDWDSFLNSGLGPGRKIRKSGIRDRDRESKLKKTGIGDRDEGFRDSTWRDCPGD